MKRKNLAGFLTLLSYLFLSSSASLSAQTLLTGKIVDPSDRPVVAANILLYDLVSNYVFGDLIIDGVLELTVKETPCIAKIQALGFEDYFVNVVEEKEVDLGTVQLVAEALELEEVEVKAKTLPRFSHEDGVLKVNVENSALSSAGTVVDILQGTPGLLVNSDRDIEMFGRGAVKIFLDGQEINDRSIIQSINSEDIKEIEVIRNPSAKYDAEGNGGVINIITKSASLEGSLWSIRYNVTRATYWRSYLGGDWTYRKGPFDAYVKLDYNPYKLYEEEEYSRALTAGGEPFTLENDVNQDYTALINNNYNVKLGYRLNDRNKIKAGIRGRFRRNDDERINTNALLKDDVEFTDLRTVSDQNQDQYFHIVDGQYQWNDTLGKTLILTGSTTRFSTESEDFIEEIFADGEVFDRRSVNDNEIGIAIAKLDYEQPLFWEFLQMETGVKFSNTTNVSDTRFFNRENNRWEESQTLKNALDYEEQNYAAYVTLKKPWKKWTFSAGLRFESTDAEASSFANGQFLDTTYNLFFKTASIDYKINDDIGLNLAYTERIDRPNYQDLDPFVQYIDSFSIIKGNPALRPALVQNIEFSGSYSGYPLLTLGYTFTDDAISLVVEKDKNNELVNVGIESNIDYIRSYSSQIVIPYQNDWWTSGNGIGYTYNQVRSDNFNGGEEFSKGQYFIFSNQDFTFKKGWTAGGLFVYFSPGTEGVFEYGSGSFTNLWFGKKLLDGRLNLRLMFNDIFKSNIPRSNTRLGDIDIAFQGYYDSRRVRFAVTYKFGKLKSDSDNDNEGSSEFNRIKMD